MSERDLFIAALEKSPSERAAWLAKACAGDQDLRQRVEVLLRAHEQASKFLGAPAVEQIDAEAITANRPTRTADGDVWADREISIDFLSPADKPGQLGKLGEYEVLEVVGRGGMGVVLKAFEPKLHRLVALKVMAPHLAASPAARRRFDREAKAVAAVRNDHVVAIHNVDANGPHPYLAMEFIGGVSLQERLDQRGPMELKEILRIGRQAATGLAAAHAQGLVHRDIKPANILLENGVERVKLTDFGLARAVDDASITQSGAITGTPNYMSPEQADGKPVDHRSDLFSLGSVLYAMATGHPPYRAEGLAAVLKRVAVDTPRPIREINPDMPDWLEAIVQKLHAKNPDDRFQSAKEVADLLGQHLAHLQQPNMTPMPAPVAAPAASGERVWKQIFEASDRKIRIAQHGLFILGLVLILAMLAAIRFSPPIGLGAGAIGFALIVLAGFIKQRWQVPYKGRTLRFENSIFLGERLFLDGKLIARGGFGMMRELRGRIPPGPGEGDEIRVFANAGLLSFRCRIEASESPAMPSAAVQSGPPAARSWPAIVVLLAVIIVPMVLGLLLAAGERHVSNALNRAEQFVPGAFFFLLGIGLSLSMVVAHLTSMRRLHSTLPAAEFIWRRRRSRTAAIVVGFLLATPFFLIGSVIWRHGRANTNDGSEQAHLAINWNRDLVKRVTIEQDGRIIEENDGQIAGAGMKLSPGAYLIRGFKDDREVYREGLTLKPGDHRGIWIFEKPQGPEYAELAIECRDPSLAIEVRGREHVFQLGPTGGKMVTQGLKVGETYRIGFGHDNRSMHVQDVTLQPGQRRELHIGPIVQWDRRTELKPKRGSFPSDVTEMQIAPDRSAVAIGRFDGPIIIFDAASGNERLTIERPKTHCTAFGFTPDSKRIAFLALGAGGEHFVRFVDATTGEKFGPEFKPSMGSIVNGHALAFSPDGDRLAVCSAENFGRDTQFFRSRIFRWELLPKTLETKKELPPMEWQDGTIKAIQFSHKGAMLVAIADQVREWNWATRTNLPRGGGMMDVLACGPNSRAFGRWNAKEKQSIISIMGSDAFLPAMPRWPIQLGSLAVSPDGSLVAAGNKSIVADPNHRGVDLPWEEVAAIRVWDTKIGVEKAVLLGHADWILALAFSRDGREILSASKDGTVRSWKLP